MVDSLPSATNTGRKLEWEDKELLAPHEILKLKSGLSRSSLKEI